MSVLKIMLRKDRCHEVSLKVATSTVAHMWLQFFYMGISTKLQDANLCLLISSVKLVTNSRRGVRFRDCEASLMRCGHVVDDVHGSSMSMGQKLMTISCEFKESAHLQRTHVM